MKPPVSPLKALSNLYSNKIPPAPAQTHTQRLPITRVGLGKVVACREKILNTDQHPRRGVGVAGRGPRTCHWSAPFLGIDAAGAGYLKPHSPVLTPVTHRLPRRAHVRIKCSINIRW